MKIKKLVIVFLFLIVHLSVFSQTKMIPVIVDGNEISYLREEGLIVAKGDVKMNYKGIELYCDEGTYNTKTNKAAIKGNVKIVQAGSTFYGQDGIYDFNTNNAQVFDIRVEQPPIYAEAKKGNKIGNEKNVLEHGYVTTCNLEKPHYRICAKRIIIYPEDRVVAKNVILKVGEIPIFYFPYISQSFNDKSFIAEASVGKEKDWGYYLLTRWRYRINRQSRGKIIFDWYDKRGHGIGVNNKIETKNMGEALIKYYQIEDKFYESDTINRENFFDRFPERQNIDAKYLEDDRYKAQISYDWQAKPNLSIKAELNKFSDEFFMQDFFKREYEIEPHPLSYILMNYSLKNASLSLLTQKRTNTFFTETEYLPQLEYNFYRKNIGSSKFYFESLDKISNLSYEVSRSNIEHNSFRVHSHNTLTYIDKIRWLNITPYVGYYANFYNENAFGDNNVWRLAPEAGLTLSTKLYKSFDLNTNIFGDRIEHIRHVLTPELSYAYIHDSTVSNGNITPVQFDAVDSLVRKDTLTFYLRNKLQGKSKNRKWDFIYFSPSVEYSLKNEGSGSYFENIKADLEIYPKEGVSFNADATYTINKYSSNRRRISTANFDVFFKGALKEVENSDVGDYSISLGHRYNRVSSTEGTLSLEYQLTPKIKFNNYMLYEYNTEDLEKQQYSIRADLHCWWMDLGVDFDRHERGGKDYTVWIMFRLKAFDDVSLGFDHGYKGGKKRY